IAPVFQVYSEDARTGHYFRMLGDAVLSGRHSDAGADGGVSDTRTARGGGRDGISVSGHAIFYGCTCKSPVFRFYSGDAAVGDYVGVHGDAVLSGGLDDARPDGGIPDSGVLHAVVDTRCVI